MVKYAVEELIILVDASSKIDGAMYGTEKGIKQKSVRKSDQHSKRIHSVESKKEINNYGSRKYVDVKIRDERLLVY